MAVSKKSGLLTWNVNVCVCIYIYMQQMIQSISYVVYGKWYTVHCIWEFPNINDRNPVCIAWYMVRGSMQYMAYGKSQKNQGS